MDGLLKVSPKQMDQSKCGEIPCFQFFVLYASRQFQRTLSKSQGALWEVQPRKGCDLGQIPHRFGQSPLIMAVLGYAPGFLQECTHL